MSRAGRVRHSAMPWGVDRSRSQDAAGWPQPGHDTRLARLLSDGDPQNRI